RVAAFGGGRPRRTLRRHPRRRDHWHLEQLPESGRRSSQANPLRAMSRPADPGGSISHSRRETVTMPTITFPIQPDGLTLDVIIGPDATQLRNRSPVNPSTPPFIRDRGVVDSASDISAISGRVAQLLGLGLHSSAQTHTAAGLIQT